jgi:hypothetical protein
MELSDLRGDLKSLGHRWLYVALVAAAGLTALAIWVSLGGSSTPEALAAEPATVELVEGSDLARITFSPSAMKRLDVKTDSVRAVAKGTSVPYGAVFYDPEGKTWVYVSPKPRTFIRQQITIAYIDGTNAFLTAGPAVGTKVATVGVQELFGAESGLGE